jgi:hypothetical protein
MSVASLLLKITPTFSAELFSSQYIRTIILSAPQITLILSFAAVDVRWLMVFSRVKGSHQSVINWDQGKFLATSVSSKERC